MVTVTYTVLVRMPSFPDSGAPSGTMVIPAASAPVAVEMEVPGASTDVAGTLLFAAPCPAGAGLAENTAAATDSNGGRLSFWFDATSTARVVAAGAWVSAGVGDAEERSYGNESTSGASPVELACAAAFGFPKAEVCVASGPALTSTVDGSSTGFAGPTTEDECSGPYDCTWAIRFSGRALDIEAFV